MEYLKEEESLAVLNSASESASGQKKDHRGGREVTGELNTNFQWPGWVGSQLE